MPRPRVGRSRRSVLLCPISSSGTCWGSPNTSQRHVGRVPTSIENSGWVQAMRVIITGNMGYIGPVVARHLANTHPDWEIVGIDSGFYADCLTGPDPARFFTKQIVRDVRDV